MVSLAIIGSVRLYREGLAAAISACDDLRVLAVLDSASASIDRLRGASPQVLIVDVQSPVYLPLIHTARRELPTIKTVAFAVEENENTLIRCAQAGVSGYVTCEASVDELVTAVRSVANEDYVCPPRITAVFLRRLATANDRESVLANEVILTARERQMVRYICDGLSNKEIAQACHISEATVKTHVHHLLEKLKMSSRNEVAARAGAPHSGRVAMLSTRSS